MIHQAYDQYSHGNLHYVVFFLSSFSGFCCHTCSQSHSSFNTEQYIPTKSLLNSLGVMSKIAIKDLEVHLIFFFDLVFLNCLIPTPTLPPHPIAMHCLQSGIIVELASACPNLLTHRGVVQTCTVLTPAELQPQPTMLRKLPPVSPSSSAVIPLWSTAGVQWGPQSLLQLLLLNLSEQTCPLLLPGV